MSRNRVEFEHQLKQRATAFYKGQCGRCERSSQNYVVEVHHVEENPDKHGSRRLSNAILLCSLHHSPIQRSNYFTRPDLADEMTPDSLRVSAFEYLKQGKYEKSYACFRLASYFFRVRQRRMSHSADCAIGCIAALRAIQGRVDADVILRDAIIDAARRVAELRDGNTSLWRALFLRQFELALFDFKEFELSMKCCRIASRLFARVDASDSLHPEDVELIKANAARAHLLASDKVTKNLLDDLRESNSVLRSLGDWRGYFTNFDVESAIEVALHGATKKARDIVDDALHHKDRISNPWVLGQLLYRQGLLRMEQDRQKNRAKAALQEALEIFQRYDITPEPRRDRDERGPGEALRVLGIEDARLILPRGRFPIRRNDVIKLINLVTGH